MTSYDATTSGNVVNQIQREFDGLGNLLTEWQTAGVSPYRPNRDDDRNNESGFPDGYNTRSFDVLKKPQALWSVKGTY